MSNQFEIVTKRIYETTNIKNQSELADALGIRPASVSDAKKRGKIPHDWIFKLADKYSLNPRWLLSEIGKPYSGNTAAPSGHSRGEVAATIQPGVRSDGAPTFMMRKESHRGSSEQGDYEASAKEDLIDESFSMSEMVTMTIEVLESKTVYRSALASNVRAFHQAVKMEGEMQGVKEEVQEMRLEHRAEMEELKEMIRSLGGAIPQKREDAANS